MNDKDFEAYEKLAHDQMMQHSAAANAYIRAEVAHLAATDPEAALFVSKEVLRLADHCQKTSAPPDKYLAKAMDILAGSIRAGDAAAGELEVCKAARSLGDRYDDAVLKDNESKDDPWRGDAA